MSLHSDSPLTEAPPRSPWRRPARVVPVAALLAGTLALAGCGGDDDSDQERPATPVTAASFNVTSELAGSIPAAAEAFAEVKLNPDGEQKAALDELVGLFGEDAGDSLLDELGLDEPKNGVSFEKDVVPHLGERAGGFAMADATASKAQVRKGEGVDGALVVTVKDREQLTTSLESSFGRSTKKVKVAGQDAYRNDDGVTLWIGEKLLVAGTRNAVTAAIEAQGGETLDKNERFTTALKQVRGNDPLALGWADMQHASRLSTALMALGDDNDAVEQLKRSGVPGGSASGFDALDQLSDATIPDYDATVAMAVLPKPGEMRVEFGGTQPNPANGSAQDVSKAGADAVASLPAGSWLALGGSVDAASGVPGADLDEQLKQLEQLTGEKLPPALTDALGKIKTVAVGVKGDSLLAIGGAAIVQTTDPAAASEMLTSIERELRKDDSLTIESTPIPGAEKSLVVRTAELPVRIAAGVKGDRLVIGLGAESVTSALEGAKTLRDDPAYAQAKQALSDDPPMLLVNPAPLAQLLGDLPAGSGDIGEIVGGLQGIKLLTASSVATGDTTWRGAFVLRYDAQQLGRVLQGGGSSSTAPPTVTDAKPGR